MRGSRLFALLIATAVLVGLGGSAAAGTFHSTDVLFVAYQPGGREFIANLGPVAGYLSASSPIDITQYTSGDLAGVYGGSLPVDLRLAVFASVGVDTYVATNGPSDASLVGSAIGASNRIRSMGGSFASSSTPVLGNPNAGTFEFGDIHSYQATLNNPYEGSLGSTV